MSLSDLLTDDFVADPAMFGPDLFHPSARGYAQASFAVLPSACAALGLLPELDEAEQHTEGVLPADRAAIMAAETAGTEVSPIDPADRPRRRGRWITRVRGPFRRQAREHTDRSEGDDARSTTPSGVREHRTG